MFINNTESLKKLVIIVLNSVATLVTLASIFAFIFSDDKRPFYVIFPVIIFQDVVWILIYIFYLSKK